jgi:hypothetical protein
MRLLDLVFGAAFVVLVFNLAALIAIGLMQGTAPQREIVSEFTSGDPEAVTEIEKASTATTPKEDRAPLPAPANIDRS